MINSHIATVNAFANKFGSFTGAIRDEVTKEVTRERFASLDEARDYVKTTAWNRYGAVKFAAMPRKGEYLANVWN